MKKNILQFILILLTSFSFAQVGIDTSNPHTKSVLEIVSKNKNTGVLFPRLTTTQIMAVEPVNGDMVVDGLWMYNTDDKCYWYWAATPKNEWVKLCGVPVGDIPIGVATMNCTAISNTGTVTQGNTVVGTTIIVPYTGGNGGSYSEQHINSTGVTGMTANLTAGSFSNGNGNLTLTVVGVPTSSGNAVFDLNIGGSTCTYVIPVNPSLGVAVIDCSSATSSGTLISGTTATGVTATIPYIGGNGGMYPAQDISSTGVMGLTASIVSGNFTNSSGNLVFNITGTPSSSGTASFNLNMGGTNCIFSVEVQPSLAVFTGPTSCSSAIVYRSNGTHLMMDTGATVQTIEFPVNVTTPGSWNITTDIEEGLQFNGSGNFASTGSQLVTLTATGSPSRAGTVIFDIPGSSVKFKVPVGNATILSLKTDQAAHSDATNSGFPTKTNLADNGFLRLDARRGPTGDTFFPIVSVLVGTVNSVASNISYNALSSENTYGGTANRNYTTINNGEYFGYGGAGGGQDLDDGLGHYRYQSNAPDNTRMNETTILTHDGLAYTVYAKWKPRSTTTYETTLRVTPRDSVINNSCQ